MTNKTEDPDALHRADLPSTIDPDLSTADGKVSCEYLRNLTSYGNHIGIEDLANPCIPYYRQLRLYNMQHITQELNHLRAAALRTQDISREELERLRILLHTQGKPTTENEAHI